jgi:hypothetical protein
MSTDFTDNELAGRLAFDILQNGTYKPVDRYGKANRANIEDSIIIAMYSGDLMPLSDKIVNIAMDLVDDVLQNEKIDMKNQGDYE